MSAIPRGVMEEARKLVDELHGVASAYPDAYYHMRARREGAYQRAAERLLARDKRAAEIVNGEAMAYAGLREGVILERASKLITTYPEGKEDGP